MTPEPLKMIYLDFQASTPVDSRVVQKMMPYFSELFGNPASQDHSWGWTASHAIEKARTQVADLFNCDSSEIFFTSGATESNNWAIIGLVRRWLREDVPFIHIITSEIEHKSVLAPLEALQQELPTRLSVTYLKPNRWGQISLTQIQEARTDSTLLVSLNWAHNEVGTIQPINEISQWTHQNKIYFHSDATQAVGKIPLDLKASPVDLLSFSSHKFYGPKGVGGLFVRQKSPRVTIDPILFGGGQERGLRAGTLNVPGIVGMGEACCIAKEDLTAGVPLRMSQLRQSLINELRKLAPELVINTHPDFFLPHALSVSFPGHPVASLQNNLSNLGMSSGSACHSANLKGSPVLRAIGLSEAEAQSTLRLSLGRGTQEADIALIVRSFAQALAKPKCLSI